VLLCSDGETPWWVFGRRCRSAFGVAGRFLACVIRVTTGWEHRMCVSGEIDRKRRGKRQRSRRRQRRRKRKIEVYVYRQRDCRSSTTDFLAVRLRSIVFSCSFMRFLLDRCVHLVSEGSLSKVASEWSRVALFRNRPLVFRVWIKYSLLPQTRDDCAERALICKGIKEIIGAPWGCMKEGDCVHQGCRKSAISPIMLLSLLPNMCNIYGFVRHEHILPRFYGVAVALQVLIHS